MKCTCGGKLLVVDTATDDTNVYRIRICNKCKKKIGSLEKTNVPYQVMQAKINDIKGRW